MTTRERHHISDRQLERALYSTNADHDVKAAVRELLDETWNKAFNAGQMKERLSGVPAAGSWPKNKEKGTW